MAAWDSVCIGEFITGKRLATTPINYYEFLTSGGTGLSGKVPDTRINGVHNSPPYSTLPPGPFQLTNGASLLYDDYAASPVHRFYQMWQQEDCNAAYATSANPSGCKADLFPWVEVTVGAGTNGAPQPANFSTDYPPVKRPPVRDRPPWAFTTCWTATPPIPRNSPTTTR